MSIISDQGFGKRFEKSKQNWFAKTACLAEDYETAAKEFATIGEDWLDSIWDGKEEFEYFKAIAKNRGEATENKI